MQSGDDSKISAFFLGKNIAVPFLNYLIKLSESDLECSHRFGRSVHWHWLLFYCSSPLYTSNVSCLLPNTTMLQEKWNENFKGICKLEMILLKFDIQNLIYKNVMW